MVSLCSPNNWPFFPLSSMSWSAAPGARLKKNSALDGVRLTPVTLPPLLYHSLNVQSQSPPSTLLWRAFFVFRSLFLFFNISDTDKVCSSHLRNKVCSCICCLLHHNRLTRNSKKFARSETSTQESHGIPPPTTWNNLIIAKYRQEKCRLSIFLTNKLSDFKKKKRVLIVQKNLIKKTSFLSLS